MRVNFVSSNYMNFRAWQILFLVIREEQIITSILSLRQSDSTTSNRYREECKVEARVNATTSKIRVKINE